jgi:hypothetical protein
VQCALALDFFFFLILQGLWTEMRENTIRISTLFNKMTKGIVTLLISVLKHLPIAILKSLFSLLNQKVNRLFF